MSFLGKFFHEKSAEQSEVTEKQNDGGASVLQDIKKEYVMEQEPLHACPVGSHRDLMWVHHDVLYFAPKRITDKAQAEAYPLADIQRFFVNPREHNEIRLQLQPGFRPQGNGEPLLFRSNALENFRELLADKEYRFSEKTMQSGKRNVRVPKIKLGDLDSVRSGAEFEEYLTVLFMLLGFQAKNTPLVKDQGIDVILVNGKEKYGIQAKFYSQPVGNSAVQQAIAGREFFNLKKGAVVTNSTFTDSAVTLAEKTNIRLIDGKELNKLIKTAKSGKISGFTL